MLILVLEIIEDRKYNKYKENEWYGKYHSFSDFFGKSQKTTNYKL